MSTEPQRTCPSCGNELSGAMEFCPVCLLRKGLSDGVESGESSASEEAVKPTPEQAAQRFEHYGSLEEGGAVAAKIIDLGLAKPAPDALKLRFQLPELLLVHWSSLVRSSSPELAWRSARTSTRWACCSGRC